MSSGTNTAEGTPSVRSRASSVARLSGLAAFGGGEERRAGTPHQDGTESPRPPQLSSAAFLHHLHTDPSSHHVSLAGPPQAPSRGSSAGKSKAGKSPRSLTLPLEPAVVAAGGTTLLRTGTEAPASEGSGPRPVPRSATLAGEQAFAVAGPSRPAHLRRNNSRRSRPNTAPGRSPSEQPNPFGGASVDPSPELQYEMTVEDSPFIAAQEDEPSACEVAMSPSGVADALSLMRVGVTRTGTEPDADGTRVLGRAGTRTMPPTTNFQSPLAVSARAGSAQGDRPSSLPSPPPQLSWATFGQSYAHGLFDPYKIPNPPRSQAVQQTRAQSRTTASSPSAPSLTTNNSSGSAASAGSSATTMTSTSSAPVSSIGSAPSRSGMAEAMAARKRAYEMRQFESGSHSPEVQPDQLQLPRYAVAAATVRLASSGLQQSDFAPLGVPSPERELLDPMASFVSSGHSTSSLRDSASSDPGTRNPLSRSMSSAVTGRESMHLPTIVASPAGTPLEHPAHRARTPGDPSRSPASSSAPAFGPGGIVGQRIPPATAPMEKTVEAQREGDYFGTASKRQHPQFDRQSSSTSQSSSNRTVTLASTPMVRSRSSEDRTAPSSDKSESPPPLAWPDDIGPIYEKFGWLPAPVPPNEEARRKALYRFNILHTSSDVNFDRIAHMAKLVFNTKIVLIALIDGEKQWHKSQTGLGSEDANRISSFCSHTLLVTSDEPFVVLDATQDWRFANNPQVTGPPNIRFYAGAPLRTSDGHNLGSLCIIDDKPRTDFPPRSRLILKEFAAVTMREMELWRDKLQLRVRDKIQTSMERFTRECLEMDARSSSSNVEAATRMDQVYARAASLACSTLDMDGCSILDLGEFELVNMETEAGTQSVYRANPYSESTVLELSGTFGPVNPLPVLASVPEPVPTRSLTGEEHAKMSDFLMSHRDGRIFENIAPSWIKYLLPNNLRYGMVVPVYGINQQPFALITAYSTNKAKQYLEGYELQFLRAIGVIILSAVLRRRMVLADKTKSVLISSVSHELRTPLHGILAAAELLSDTDLDSNQMSFLKTVQTCGNTLIETVNHVLDFTKLSGSSGSSSEGTIKLAKVNLAALVEQTVEGVWIGQRARFFMGDADIGSFYAPPPTTGLVSRDQAANIVKDLAHVETVIDIGTREKGWMVRCERGGLRRVLMNLVGNSLKFTKDGYVQVTLKELPHSPGSKTIPVEMAVIDTGKGIGKDFLKDQLFHPFSQENPLQTGTGLGLAIVNSIVRSDNVNGKVDVWSSEGQGTEIRISFEVEVFDEDDEQSSSSSSSVTSVASGFGRGHSLAFHGYDGEKRGNVLALDVLSSYAVSWHFELRDEGDILILNEDEELMQEFRDSGRAMIFLSSNQTSATIGVRDSINRAGGHCQIVHKPIGPTAFRQALQRVVVWLEHREGGITPSASEVERPHFTRGESGQTVDSTMSGDSADSGGSADSNSTVSELSHAHVRYQSGSGAGWMGGRRSVSDRQPLVRRRSEEQETSMPHGAIPRPPMAPRGLTYHHGAPGERDPHSGHGGHGHGHGHAPFVPPRKSSVASDISVEGPSSSPLDSPLPGSPTSSTSQLSTISLADGGVMLKAAQLPASAPRPARTPRVMVVEDNVINRRVLGAFLKKRGFEYDEAHDGRAGVELFERTPAGYWDVILMDISMPVMNGHEATRAIRQVESGRRQRARVRATGSSSGSNSKGSGESGRSSSSSSSGSSLLSSSSAPHAAHAAQSTLSPLSPLAGTSTALSGMPKQQSPEPASASASTSTSASALVAPAPIVPDPKARASSVTSLSAPVQMPPAPVVQSRAKIFALTGLATADDKREAFGSGVDGYLVKPVSLTSLDLIFKKIGFL